MESFLYIMESGMLWKRADIASKMVQSAYYHTWHALFVAVTVNTTKTANRYANYLNSIEFHQQSIKLFQDIQIIVLIKNLFVFQTYR